MTQLLRLLKTEGDASWHCSACAENFKNLSVCLCSVVEQCDVQDPISKVWDSFWYPYSQKEIKAHLHTVSGVDWEYLSGAPLLVQLLSQIWGFEPQVMLPKAVTPRAMAVSPWQIPHPCYTSTFLWCCSIQSVHVSSSFFQLENCRNGPLLK